MEDLRKKAAEMSEMKTTVENGSPYMHASIKEVEQWGILHCK